MHLNSWVIVHGGGSDLDSPYDVRVQPGDPALDDTLACAPAGAPLTVRPGGIVGSPIGFRSFFGTLLDPASMFLSPAQSLLFPVFDPTSFLRAPVIGAHAPMPYSGKAYFSLRALDSDGEADASIPNAAAARTIVEAVEAGTGTPAQIALRPKILTFYVNQAPFLLFGQPSFVPRPNYVFTTRELSLHMPADDSDPLDPASRPPFPGGPSTTKVLRWNVKALGRNAAGAPVSYSPIAVPTSSPDFGFRLPEEFADSNVTIEVQLCDCATCETLPGSGRCVTYSIPVVVPPDSVTASLASLFSTDASAERVRLEWQVRGLGATRVERRQRESGWRDLGEVYADGTGRVSFEDLAVVAGERYAYRLVLRKDGETWRSAEEWVDVPLRAELALQGVRPNPSDGRDLMVHFSLARSGVVRLELLDVGGRRVLERKLDALGPGRHAIRLEPAGRIPPGIYLVRLTQGGEARMARTAILQ